MVPGRASPSYGGRVPFLLLATRPEDVAADEEYASFLACTGLEPSELVRRRLDRETLGDVDLAQWQGILLGGSPFTTSDPAASKSATQVRVEAELGGLLDRVVAADAPFLGACYGIGTLGSHQGAVVDRTYGEPIGAVPVTLTEAGRQDPLLSGLPPSFDAFVGHKEAVRRLPPHAVLLASSPTCPVQAFRVGHHVYATQFHPELDLAGLRTRIEVYRDAGYFPPGQADRVLAEVAQARVEHPPLLLRAFVARYA